MNEDLTQSLHKLLSGFITQNGLNPTNIKINFSPTKAVIVLDILPKVADEDRRLVD